MRLLLDTHALIWWLAGEPSLSNAARRAIGSDADEVFVSAVSTWEIATKFRLGKLPSVAAIANDLTGTIALHHFIDLPISLRHGEAAGALPGLHRDPFDRLLIAQAMAENLILVSNEQLFDGYGVARLW